VTPGELGRYYGLIVVLCGSSSSFLGGWVSTKLYERGMRNGAAWVCLVGSLGSIPFVVAMLSMDLIVGDANDTSYALALVALAGAYLTAECWLGPASAIGINVYPVRLRTSASAVFSMALAVIGSTGPVIVGVLNDHTPSSFNRYNLMGAIAIPYALSAIGFFVVSRTMIPDTLRSLKEQQCQAESKTHKSGDIIESERQAMSN
jgi:hypothetical protein